MDLLPEPKYKIHFAQTPLEAHESWEKLIARSPLAARVMHLLVSQIGHGNAVAASQRVLADLLNCSERGVRDAVNLLRRERWIDVRQVGARGTVNAYVVNAHVAWTGPRDGIRYAILNTALVLSSAEQPDADELDSLPPLRQVPELFPGERQLPTGDGLPPPSEQALPGLVPDVPAIIRERDDGEAEPIGDIVTRLELGKFGGSDEI